MARGVNKVILLGNLGQAPEVKYMPNGNAVANVTIATSESWKDKNTGQEQSKVEWHSISFMGKLAEIAGQYLKKGSQVYVQGKLQTRKYQDKQTGADKYSTSIIVDSFSGVLQMLGSKQGGQQQAQAPQQQYQKPQQPAPQAPPANFQPQMGQQAQQAPGDFDNNFDDDLPF